MITLAKHIIIKNLVKYHKTVNITNIVDIILSTKSYLIFHLFSHEIEGSINCLFFNLEKIEVEYLN